MPRILIVAATPFEISPLCEHFKIVQNGVGIWAGQENVTTLITGVGMVNTAYAMGHFTTDEFDLVINAGVCGAFKDDFALGEIVNVTSDTLAEMGAEDDEKFIHFEQLNLGGSATFYPKIYSEHAFLKDLKKVKGITVNKVHGNNESIRRTQLLLAPDVESMEGAAFFRACEHLNAECVQLRAVSNKVERRDKNKWQMPLAIGNLNRLIIQFINNLPT